jgi:DNA-binding response OmpR family regulator
MSDPRSIKILLAEDEEMISTAYKEGFSYLGYDIVVACDGAEAIEAIKASMPDILLLDVIMPTMNGFEALEVIRANSKLKTLPIVMLTNLSQPSDRQRALELGATDYLIKSDITLKELVVRILEVLAKANA